ncbi:MAG: hypothetical protein KDD89_00760 [Anaerolineales bacterium]|nr:hypothetical protein [Anaerolineales bacterium]
MKRAKRLVKIFTSVGLAGALLLVVLIATAVAQTPVWSDDFTGRPSGTWEWESNPEYFTQNGLDIVSSLTNDDYQPELLADSAILRMYPTGGVSGNASGRYTVTATAAQTLTVSISTTYAHDTNGNYIRVAPENEPTEYVCDGRVNDTHIGTWFDIDCPLPAAGDYIVTFADTSATHYADSAARLSYRWDIAEIRIATSASPPPTPTPSPNLTPTIPLTYTCYINASNPSQGANLIQNGSFEDSADGGYTPTGWASNPNIIIANDYWKEIPAQAADGDDYLLHRLQPSASIYQVVEVLTDTQVLVGTAFRSPVGGGSASMSFTPPVTGTLYMTSTSGADWQLHEFTTTLTAGNYTLNLNVPDTTANGESAALDLVYMFPVTAGGTSVWCPFFNTVEVPTPPPSGTGSIIGYPGWSGSGAYCQTCPLPSSILQVGAWIGWLGCVLTNLFFCWLETWLANLYNAIGASLAWLAYAWNALVNIIEALWALAMVVWNYLAGYIEGIWGWFTTFMSWLVVIIEAAAGWAVGVLANLWTVYIPGALEAIWSGAVWVAEGALAVVGWLWSIVLAVAWWLVDRFWDVVSYLDPLALLVWFLQLPFIQTVLNTLDYFGIGSEIGRLVLYAMATVTRDIYEAFVEMQDLIMIVVNEVRGSFVGESYEVIVNVDGEDVSTIDPIQLGYEGFNFTKLLWLALAAISSVDYMVEVLPLELALWLAIGALAFGLVLWTAYLWREILPI